MITFTEFFLFISLMVAIGVALHYKKESSKSDFLLHLFLTNPKARDEMIDGFCKFKQAKDRVIEQTNQ
jgi:hypothetical protein